MKLSKRLKAILNEIKSDSIVDIGTDHAYIPIAAVLNNKIKKAIASDIKTGPLEIAKKNIIAHGLENQIETRLSNGFENVLAGEAETAIISGMGGFIICKIISRAQKILPFFKQLIIQPQNNIYHVRKILYDLDFRITNEIIIYQNGFYNIITAQPEKNKDKKNIFYSEKDLLLGKILPAKRENIFKQFLLYQIKKLFKIKNFSAQANKFYKIYLEAFNECFVKK